MCTINHEPSTTDDIKKQQLPVSFSQQRLWLANALSSYIDISYNQVTALELSGKLNLQALCESLNTIIDRHESLRTTFHSINENVVQKIQHTHNKHIEIIEVSEQQVDQRITHYSTLPFDLSTGPLIRITLFILSADKTILIINMHHIVTDSKSLQIFGEELNYLYQQKDQHTLNKLASLQWQYQDYVQWEIEQAATNTNHPSLHYWCESLKDAPASIALPTDYQRKKKASQHGANYRFSIPPQLAQQITQFTESHHCSTFSVVLAVFAILLYRYSNQNDFCIGSPVPNRQEKQFDNIIGFFANILVLRMQLKTSLSFAEFVKQVEQHHLQSLAHQDMPFDKLVESLNPSRNGSQSPLFQVMFFIQKSVASYFALPNIASKLLTADTHTSKYELSLIVTENDDGISHALFEYSTDLFKQSTIERMATHFLLLLENSLNYPAATLSSVPMISADEYRHLIYDINNCATPYPSELCIHQLFEQHAQLQPNTAAVVFNDQKLSYGELNQYSNQLAHYLISQGIGADNRVGILINRSLDVIKVMLAILKAGASYVPIDSALPQQRIHYLIDNSQMQLLLVHANFETQATTAATPVVVLDNDSLSLDTFSSNNPRCSTSALNLAYINYTSGSTGRPKGVAVTHQAVNRLVINNQRLPLKKGCCLIHLASTSFDAATFEIWGSLLNAGTCIVNSDNIPALHALEKTITQHKIDTLWLTTALFTLIIDEKLSLLDTIKTVVTGGEILSRDHAQRAITQLPDVRFFNVYGPTENTTFSTVHEITTACTLGQKNIPIGKPINNSHIYIFDEQLNPVPIGVIGELYTGGDGLSRGYLFNPELSAEKFIPHPHSHNPGERLYKTGDLVRIDENDAIEFITRADNQVKMRGYRIELSEIEHCLIQHHLVKTAVVIAKKDNQNTNTQALIAHVVLNKNSDDNAQSNELLRTFLQSQLPEYMVPTSYHFLNELPQTSSGKLDINALPATLTTNNTQTRVKPNTDIEKKLCEIWQQVLQLEQIGINDNFFTTGGDSILSLLVVAKARDAGIRINASQLFDHQNIEELARHCTVSYKRISQDMSQGQLALLPIQQWYLNVNNKNPHHFNQYCLLKVPEQFDIDFLKQTIQALYRRHDVLHLQFTHKNNAWAAHYGEISNDAINHCVKEYQLPHTKIEQSAFMEREGAIEQASLSISNGPLLKAIHFKSNNTNHSRLLLIIHHLVVDGVSWRILLQDITTAYEQFYSEQTITLKEKTNSYQEWAKNLYDYSQDQAIENQKSFWYSQLSTSTATLPKDHQHAKSTDYSTICAVNFTLSKSQTQALLLQCQQSYQTRINEFLVAGLCYAYQQWTKQSTLRLSLEGHGREDLFDDCDISETLGWFTSLFPLTLQWEKNANIESVIKSTKEQIRAIPNNGIGYGILYYLNNDQHLQQLAAQNPPEIIFNYLGQFDQNSGNNNTFIKTIENVGNRVDSNTARDHSLRFTGEISQHCLRFIVDYDSNEFTRNTIEHLLTLFQHSLLALIEHCTQIQLPKFTPSDFVISQLTQPKIDQWQQHYGAIEDIYPATPMQIGMLYHSQYYSNAGETEGLESTPNNDSYATQFIITFTGNIDSYRFKRVWEKIVQRHSVFRTAFCDLATANAQQIVVPEIELNWFEEDWRSKSPEQFSKDFEHYRQHDKYQKFEHEHAGLMRFSVFLADNNCLHFLWTHHHSLIDGWSVPILLAELINDYQHFANEDKQPMVPVEPYKNYVQWLYSQPKDKAKLFWKDYLQGIQHATSISFESVNENDNTPTLSPTTQRQPQQKSVSLSAANTDLLRRTAKHYRVTINTLIQAMWAYLLYRYSGKTDVIFGQILSGRPADLPRAQHIVGLLINSVPMRVVIDTTLSIQQWFENIHKSHNESEQFSYLSLFDIAQCSQFKKGTSLFDSLIALQINTQQTNASHNSNNDINVTDIICDEQTHYDLTLAITSNDTLSIVIKYNSLTYTDDHIDTLLNDAQAILTRFTDSNIESVGQLSSAFLDHLFSDHVIDNLLTNIPSNTLDDETKPNSESATTDLEKLLLEIWTDTLQLDSTPTNIHNNFFELGGHSLTAMQVIQRIYETTQIQINVKDMFSHPTIASMEKYLLQKKISRDIFGNNTACNNTACNNGDSVNTDTIDTGSI